MVGAELTVEQLVDDPHPHLHRLRSDTPVAWVPAIERWVVTDRALVIEALREPVRFTVDDPRFTTAQVVGPSMLSLDGPEHARHRQPFVPPFRRSAIMAGFEAPIREIADHLPARFDPDDTDLRRDLAAPLAAEAVTLALGLVGASVDELLGWYREIVKAVEAATVGDQPTAGATVAFDALGDAVERSRLVTQTPMASIDASGGLTPTELHANTAVMLFGAIETSEGMTANALYHVLRDASLVGRLRAEPDLIPVAIEESLRLEPAATLVDRYTTAVTRLGGVELPERAAVALSLAGANRDPAYFPHPDRFDLNRANADHHLAFVVGPHACIGMHLARLETDAALRAVLALPSPPRILDELAARPTGLVFRKPAAVRVSQ